MPNNERERGTIDSVDSMTREQRMIAFASCVLDTMEEQAEWSADTLDAIANDAMTLRLAIDDDGRFEAVLS